MKKDARQTLHFTDSGGKMPVIIFLHFFGGSSLSWRNVIAGLESAYRCIAIDLHGFGQSPQPEKYFSVNDHALSVLELADSLGIEHFFLVGHSMGGKIALAIAAASAFRTSGLILAAPSPPTPEPFKRGERVALRNAFGREDKVRALLRAAFGRKATNEIFEQAVADNLRTSRTAWNGWISVGSRENISPAMKNIKCPVIIISGEKDKKFSTSFLKNAVASEINVRIIREIKSVGHLIPLAAPQETVLAVKWFLDRL